MRHGRQTFLLATITGLSCGLAGLGCGRPSGPAAAPEAAPAPEASAAPEAAPAAAALEGAAAVPTVQVVPVPGAPPDGVFMDYITYDAARNRVWIPAGSTGSVDVIDTTSGKLTRLEGFPTGQMERRGKMVTVGPSSATVGDGVVYIGNRSDFTVCAVDAATLAKKDCLKLDAMPDGIAYVAATKEVWVTTPRDNSLRILDARGPLKLAAKVPMPGQPEGFAVDDARGVFYTNLEDKDKTLTLDLHSRKVTRTWEPHCGEDGPKGLSLDHKLDFLVVACADHVIVLDAGHDGAELSRIDTGDGVDNIDYVESRRALYVGAAAAAKMTEAHLDDKGLLTATTVVPTIPGARNAVATAEGVAYLTSSPAASIVIVTPATP